MDIAGKKVTIVGLGRSGVAAARLVRHLGGQPVITDMGQAELLSEFIGACEAEGISYEVGGHTAAAFDATSLIIMSPGVPASIPPVAAASARGVEVVGELEFASRFCNSKLLAVTGTNGKTTTTELLYHIARTCGVDVALAGNNATPLSEVVLRDSQPAWVVLEVSSYQLETTQRFHPWIACVLNLTPDHLGRHGTMEGYASAKARIFKNQNAADNAINNLDDQYVTTMQVPEGVQRLNFSMRRPVKQGLWWDGDSIRRGSEVIATSHDFQLPGKHNVENILAALCMAHAAGLHWEGVLEGLRSFRGVEHRIEFVRELNGVSFYNDSKSTNIDSLRVALESFDKPLILIAGGRGKGASYAPLRDLVEAHVAHLVAIGEDAPLMKVAFSDLVPVHLEGSMEEAVSRAAQLSQPGEVVLLSPACASFDMYRNFEERGRDFKSCVSRIESTALILEDSIQ